MPTKDRKPKVPALAKLVRQYGVPLTGRKVLRKGYTKRNGVKVPAKREPVAFQSYHKDRVFL